MGGGGLLGISHFETVPDCATAGFTPAANAKCRPEAAFSSQSSMSDSDAELASLLPGSRVEVIRGAVVELVAQAKFPAHVDPDGGHGHPNGEPTEHAKSVVVPLGLLERRKWKSVCGHGRNGLLHQ